MLSPLSTGISLGITSAFTGIYSRKYGVTDLGREGNLVVFYFNDYTKIDIFKKKIKIKYSFKFRRDGKCRIQLFLYPPNKKLGAHFDVPQKII